MSEHGRRAGVVVVLLLAGFLVTVNARLTGGVDARQPQDFADLVEVELARVETLEAEVTRLQQEIDELAGTGVEPGTDPQAELTALAAGRRAVVGPGVTVELTDAPVSGKPSWATADDLVVHQQDMQAVINALWAGGAEAMSLQDQRVISTSAFRCVGNVLLLHGRQYSPPYVIRAIGDPEELTAALHASPAVQTYLDYVAAVGLGWSVRAETELELPAYEGNLELRYAEAADD